MKGKRTLSEDQHKAAVKQAKRTKRRKQLKLPFEERSLTSRYNTLLIKQRGKCKICKIKEWMGTKIRLHYDHKDGNPNNNARLNSRLICPNCHSQTSNYCGKNKRTQKTSDDEMVRALNEFPNIRQALISLHMSPRGGNYTRAKRLLDAQDP